MKTPSTILPTLLLLSSLNFPRSTAFAQGTAFTYQGRLNDGANPASGSYDVRFILYNTDSGGSQVGPIRTNGATAVSNGLFVVTLDFGANIFTGADRFLEIAVRTNSNAGFTTLSPRQKLTPAPYTIFAANVGSGGLAAGTYANAFLFNNPANSFYGDGLGLVNLSAAQLSVGTVPDARLPVNIARTNQVWNIGGNAGTSSDFIGTTDNQPFDVRVNNARVMRYRLNADGEGNCTNAPNVIGGSSVNTVSGGVVGATIGGGGGNFTTGQSLANQVTADFATVGGGWLNTASGDLATVAGGNGNTASGTDAMVPGGYSNTAGGHSSFAAGYLAHAGHEGSFVWADYNGYPFSSTTANQFRVRATGGAAFATAIDYSNGNVTAGVHLFAGDTAWSSISDRNQKKNFEFVDKEAVLKKLAAITVEKWNYKWEPDTNTPHLGPMAQDFKAAFYPGRDDKTISTLEFDGVELAAIQGLNEKLDARNSELKQRLAQKETEIAELQQRLEKLERLVERKAPPIVVTKP